MKLSDNTIAELLAHKLELQERMLAVDALLSYESPPAPSPSRSSLPSHSSRSAPGSPPRRARKAPAAAAEPKARRRRLLVTGEREAPSVASAAELKSPTWRSIIRQACGALVAPFGRTEVRDWCEKRYPEELLNRDNTDFDTTLSQLCSAGELAVAGERPSVTGGHPLNLFKVVKLKGAE